MKHKNLCFMPIEAGEEKKALELKLLMELLCNTLRANREKKSSYDAFVRF